MAETEDHYNLKEYLHVQMVEKMESQLLFMEKDCTRLILQKKNGFDTNELILALIRSNIRLLLSGSDFISIGHRRNSVASFSTI